MKRILLAGVGVLALASLANAADLPRQMYTKAPPPMVAPYYNWTGFYLGINGGGAWGTSNWSSTGDFDVSGGMIGGTIGYNWQTGPWVFGLEGDVDWASVKGTTNNVGCLGGGCSSENTWLGTARGRVGYAFDRWLVYGTGGAAIADLKDTYTSPTFAFVAAPGATTWGWTAGGGVEYAVADHWTVKAEYLHVGFGNRTVDNLSTFGYGLVFKDRLDIARVGINYKF